VEESASLGALTPDQVQTDAFMQVSACLHQPWCARRCSVPPST